LAPEFLDSIPGWDRKLKFPQLPHGIYFVTGGKWFAFHIRFRELSRGGMRTVVARGAEHEAYERPNMFSECYNLALTQQKKNKDIPEGGAKSILFLRAEGAELEDELRLVRKELGLGLGGDEIEKKVARYRKEHEAEYMYYSQRCFLRTILSMFVWDFAKSRLKHGASTLDYLRSPEFIYFGPDENFHDCMIEWVAQEAQRMGYYPGGAFISGKARAGINHKEFGVTSLGALQFLNQGLSFLGIGQGAGRFTVKMTGGPDGDVAGNFLRLMRKNYGTRAAVVVITDGSGTAYEPKGFDLEVLEGMFHRVEAISEYPPERLSEEGWVLQMNKVRQASSLTKECRVVRKAGEEWIPSSAAHKLYASNAHVTPADVFLPCGGRPRSLSVDNVESFFDPKTGAPTSRLVVEGANLYITPQAREVLEDRGVVVFKDSSANKCGVVSSSYEILAGLSLTEDQFAKIKPDLARDILSRLETIANDEARCMIEYYAKNGRRVHMAQISELVSERINKFTDEIAAFLKPLDLAAPENAALHEQFVTYVPQCIRSKYLSQCIAFVPEMHKKAIIATRIACNLVYSRGLDWEPSVVDILEILLPQVH
jgi:glutamate dehydrogenase